MIKLRDIFLKQKLGSHFVSGFYSFLSKMGKLQLGLLTFRITSSNIQGRQTGEHLQ